MTPAPSNLLALAAAGLICPAAAAVLSVEGRPWLAAGAIAIGVGLVARRLARVRPPADAGGEPLLSAAEVQMLNTPLPQPLSETHSFGDSTMHEPTSTAASWEDRRKLVGHMRRIGFAQDLGDGALTWLVRLARATTGDLARAVIEVQRQRFRGQDCTVETLRASLRSYVGRTELIRIEQTMAVLPDPDLDDSHH